VNVQVPLAFDAPDTTPWLSIMEQKHTCVLTAIFTRSVYYYH